MIEHLPEDPEKSWGSTPPHLQVTVPTLPSSCQAESVDGPHLSHLCGPLLTPCPTCGHSTPSSNWGEVPHATCLTQGVQWEVEASWEGTGGGAARSGSSPLSCASSGRPEDWFHQGESLFVLPSRPGWCRGHQGGVAPPPYCSGSDLRSCRPFQTQGPAPPPVPSLGSHLHDNGRNVSPGLIWRLRGCPSVTSGLAPQTLLGLERGLGQR